jgi:hypothetical protein
MLMMNILRIRSECNIVCYSFDFHSVHSLLHAQNIFTLIETAMAESNIANIGTLSHKVAVDTTPTTGIIMAQTP